MSMKFIFVYLFLLLAVANFYPAECGESFDVIYDLVHTDPEGQL